VLRAELAVDEAAVVPVPQDLPDPLDELAALGEAKGALGIDTVEQRAPGDPGHREPEGAIRLHARLQHLWTVRVPERGGAPGRPDEALRRDIRHHSADPILLDHDRCAEGGMGGAPHPSALPLRLEAVQRVRTQAARPA
jgi:hypothetical protein